MRISISSLLRLVLLAFDPYKMTFAAPCWSRFLFTSFIHSLTIRLNSLMIRSFPVSASSIPSGGQHSIYRTRRPSSNGPLGHRCFSKRLLMSAPKSSHSLVLEERAVVCSIRSLLAPSPYTLPFANKL